MASKEKARPPKLNKFMHPKNPYRTPPSFKKLAAKYPEFRSHCSYDVSGKVHLDFKNPLAVRALTTCLLEQDFDLKVSIPENRLVPTLPLRLNYLLWVQDLLTHAAHHQPDHSVVGVDIGCGALCVYPLLASRKLGWSMVATEMDQVNFDAATDNVSRNNLQDQVLVKKVEEKMILTGVIDSVEIIKHVCMVRNREREGHEDEDRKGVKMCKDGQGGSCEGKDPVLDFTMCNPPFFGSEEETDTMTKSKKTRGEPVSAPTGAVHEKVTDGGEVAFITQMINESQQLSSRVRIFTTLIGSKSHIKAVKNALTVTNPKSHVLTEFCQGRTMRWGLAWTYHSGVELGNVKSKKEMMTKKPLVLNIPRSRVSVYSVPAVWSRIASWLHLLKVKVQVFKSSRYFVSANVKAYKPTWLHQRRKKREEKRKKSDAKCANGEDKASMDLEVSSSCQKRKLETETQKQEVKDAANLKKPKLDDTDRELADAEKINASWPEEKESQIACSGENGQCKKLNRDKIKTMKPEEEKEDRWVASSDEHKQKEEEKNDSWNVSGDENKEEKAENMSTEDNQLDSAAELRENKGKGYAFKDTRTESSQQDRSSKLEYILRCNLQVKQSGGLISLEAFYLDGSSGKDGLNQMLQFMRNKLTNPDI